MPIEPFNDLFQAWPCNDKLDIHKLRIKTLALLALTVMLRPSDAAPKAELLDIVTGEKSKLTLTTAQVKFEHDGSVTLWLHGIKNDANRDGFQVNIPPASQTALDPVCALRTYLDRTAQVRGQDGPVFMSLRQPYKAIGSATVAKDLVMAIEYAGLGGKGYSAKSFRPTGATVALQSGCTADSVRAIGRWKCQEVFEAHYVYPKAPAGFTDAILFK
jgi:hypothetical protein